MILPKSNTNSFEIPVCKQTRVDSLDVLRGIALCGVFITHFICQFYGLAFTPIAQKAIVTTPFDPVFEKALRFILFDKPRGMFSFLFGVGFYYQLKKAAGNGLVFKTGFLKRLTILFLFGLIHSSFFFEGDVLRYYAILGLLLLFSYKMKPAFLLTTAFLCAVVLPSICTFFPNDLFIGTINTPAIFAIFGQFLLGFWVARKKIPENLMLYRLKIRKVFLYSLSINICLSLIRVIFHYAETQQFITGAARFQDTLDLTFVIGIQAMIVVFITGFLLLYTSAKWKLRLQIFIPAGRMTLTNYIAQSLIAIVLFEMGIYEMLGTVASFLMSICLCVLQLYTSRWWLQYYKSGPLEWIWRSLAAMSWEPERRFPPTQHPETIMKADRENGTMEPSLSTVLTG